VISSLLAKFDTLVFVDKDFVYGSLFPVLVFVFSTFFLIGDVVGFQMVIGYWTSRTSTIQAEIFGLAIFLVIVFAYLMFGLRPLFLRLWCGTAYENAGWIWAAGKRMFYEKFEELRYSAQEDSQWDGADEKWRKLILPLWKTPNENTISPREYKQLLKVVKNLSPQLGWGNVEIILKDKVAAPYEKYWGSHALEEVYRTIKMKLQDWADARRHELVRRRVFLDRYFDDSATIRPTALGNVVESYNAYPFKRYGMEGELLWAHMQHVIKKEFLDRIRDARIIFDFVLTMATLGMVVSLLCLLIGPWIMFFPLYWASWSFVAFLVSYTVYYKMAVFLAVQYGDLLRASYDLFRLELFKELAIELPADRDSELIKWRHVSQLLSYGQGPNYKIAAKVST